MWVRLPGQPVFAVGVVSPPPISPRSLHPATRGARFAHCTAASASSRSRAPRRPRSSGKTRCWQTWRTTSAWILHSRIRGGGGSPRVCKHTSNATGSATGRPRFLKAPCPPCRGPQDLALEPAHASLLQLLRTPHARFALGLSLVLLLAQQVSGITTIGAFPGVLRHPPRPEFVLGSFSGVQNHSLSSDRGTYHLAKNKI